MILCAAIKLEREDGTYLVVPCRRHSDGLFICQRLNSEWHNPKKTQGFIDTNGVFHTRKSAYLHARAFGQLSLSVIKYKEDRNQDELYSEDLY